jgi:hypothetical protein
VLFSPDEQGRQALIASLAHRGFVAVPLSFEPGIRAEAAAPALLRGWLEA